MNWYQKNCTEIDEQFMINILQTKGPAGYLVFQEVRAFLGKKNEFGGGEIDAAAMCLKLQLKLDVFKSCLLYLGAPGGKFTVEETGRKDRYFVYDPYLVKIADNYTRKSYLYKPQNNGRTKSDNVRTADVQSRTMSDFVALQNNNNINTINTKEEREKTDKQVDRQINPINYYINIYKDKLPHHPPLVLSDFDKKDLQDRYEQLGTDVYKSAVDWFFENINDYDDYDTCKAFKKDLPRIVSLSQKSNKAKDKPKEKIIISMPLWNRNKEKGINPN